MTDIVERIRKLRFVHIPGTSDLMEEACQEIKRLRTLATQATPSEGSVQNGCTLTDEEREAVETADAYMSAVGCHNTNVQKTLRGLLERLR